MLFRKFNFDDFDIVAEKQSKTEYNGSEYSELFLRGWKFYNINSMQICIDDEDIYLRFEPHPEIFDPEYDFEGKIYLPPIAPIERISASYDKLLDYCIENDEPFYVMATPEEYVKLLDGNKYQFAKNEIYSEYLYLPSDLIALAGKKYHSKRNHVKNFQQMYSANDEHGGYTFRKYEESDHSSVMQLFGIWLEKKNFEEEYFQDELDEVKAIQMEIDLLGKCRCVNCFADVIEYEGKIIAFALGEITPSNVGIVHLEKADVEYEGAYSAINQFFAEKHFEHVRYINRQEDMGLDGLRQSKRSYYPVAYADKYAITQRKDD